jgi:hypothetical protein
MFPRTKRQYVAQQVFAFVLMIPLVVIWAFWVHWNTQITPEARAKALPVYLNGLLWILDQIPWAVGILLAALIVETIVVLKAFARKEAAQQASEAAVEKKDEAAETPSSEPVQDTTAIKRQD